MPQITCPPEALAKITNAIYKTGPPDCLLSSELLYRSKQRDDGVDDTMEESLRSAIELKLRELVEDLKENEEFDEVWTTWDDRLKFTVD